MKKTTVAQKFWARVNFNGPIPIFRPDLGPCWIWAGSRLTNGYARLPINNGKKNLLGHRVSYTLMKGKIPAGLQIDHLCRVRHCVNPHHLEAVTCRINLLRGKTLTAENAAKTICPKGHKYTKANTYTDKDNCRHCRICKKAAWHRWYERHRA